MKIARTILVPGLFIVLILSACSPAPSTTPPAMTLVTDIPLPLPGPILPVCLPEELTSTTNLIVDASSLVMVTASIPVIDSLTPILRWDYDDSVCAPTGFVVSIADQNADASLNWKIIRVVGPAERAYAVTPADGLEPAKQYLWQVRPYVGSPDSLGYSTDAYGTYKRFFTGPLCTTTTAVAPLITYPPDGMVFTGGTEMTGWIYPEACLPTMYELDRATDPAFTTNLQVSTWSYFSHGYDWVGPDSDYLKDCTLYYWRVGASNDGITFVYSETRSFFMSYQGACSGTPSTPTPTASVGLGFVPRINANCRPGPDIAFNPSGLAMTGLTYPLIGRDVTDAWYYIQLTPNVMCWVQKSTGDPNGDTGDLPYIQGLPTPTPVSAQLDCSQFSVNDCYLYPNDCTVDPSGACVNK